MSILWHTTKHLQINMLPYFLESRSQKSEKKQNFKHVCNGKCKCKMEIIFTYITNRRKAHMFALGWLLVQRCKFHLFIVENRAIFCNFLVTLHLIWNPRTQLLINWYTACKTYSKMTHNVTLATWKLIPCPNLPVVWYRMLPLFWIRPNSN